MTNENKPRRTATARKTTDARAPGKPKKAATTSAAGAAGSAAVTSAGSAAPVQRPASQPKPPATVDSEALQGSAAPAADAPTEDSLHRRIAEAAYYRAERRGFAPGGEAHDWFEAEAEIRGPKR